MNIDWAAEAEAIRAKREAPKKGAGKRRTPERSVQVAIKRYLETVIPGCEVCAIENERGARSSDPHAAARFQAARKASGTRPGCPDLVVVCPDGLKFFVEVKAPGGVLSATQNELHARWRAMGHTVLVADSIETLRWGLSQADIRTIERGGAARAPQVRVAKRKAMPADAVLL
jgi:hypothetical protein